MRALFCPNKVVSRQFIVNMAITQAIIAVVIWSLFPPQLLPAPLEILKAFGGLWQDGLAEDLFVSIKLNLEALAIGTLISLLFAYMTTLPFFRPVIGLISKFRFWGMVGLTVIFALATSGGHSLKLSMLVFSIVVFYVTAMAKAVMSVPQEELDYARTMRMSEWHIVWEIIILGRRDEAIEYLRQNAAISWMMLTMVEGLSRSEGGIGVLLLNQNKHFHLAEVFAIQLAFLLVALASDYMIGVAKNAACPHVAIEEKRRS